jgi:hypothetical protein
MKKANPRRLTLLGFLTAKGWVWKAAIAGLCGSITHTLLMVAKAQLGILESFQPYQSLQLALSHWTGESVHPMVPWLLSFVLSGCLRKCAKGSEKNEIDQRARVTAGV